MSATPPDFPWIGALARTVRKFSLGHYLEQSLQFVVPLGLSLSTLQIGQAAITASWAEEKLSCLGVSRAAEADRYITARTTL